MSLGLQPSSHARVTMALTCCAEAARSDEPDPKRPRMEASSAENGQSHRDAGSRAQPRQIIRLKNTVSKPPECLLKLCELMLHCC